MVVTVRHQFNASVGAVGFGAKPIYSVTSPPKESIKTQAHKNVPRFSNGCGGVYVIPRYQPNVLPTAKVDFTTLQSPSPSLGIRKKARGAMRLQAPPKFPVLNAVVAPPPFSVIRSRAVKKQKISAKRDSGNVVYLAFRQAVNNPIVVKISQTASKVIDDIEERQLKSTAKRRISEALIGLKAASERSISIRSLLSEDDDASSRQSSLRDIVGDMGLALFSPIDDEVFKRSKEPHVVDDGDSLADDVDAMEIEDYPVDLQPETRLTLAACPRILTAPMIQQLVDSALPNTLKMARWDRIYALGRDGDAFITMLDRCAQYKDTIIVVQTTKGFILGGYAASPWNKQEGYDGNRSFYGNGQSFLFASEPAVSPEADDAPMEKKTKPLHVYTWTGSNTYCQICDIDDGQLAMGGGGSFGLVVESNFARGTTGRCATFGNPQLVPCDRGTFEIANFEVYGFTSMAQIMSPPMSPVPCASQRSIILEDSY